MDPIKEAFIKIKEDMNVLKEALFTLKDEFDLLKIEVYKPTNQQTNTFLPEEIPQQTNKPTPVKDTPTDNINLYGLYGKNINISTGNRGVPTNKPTNKPTNQHPIISDGNTLSDDFKKANIILESLDGLKKEIRLKFKRLTPQEMAVFSTIYSLEEQNHPEITYKLLAELLKLSEASIRDYTNKIISKGIPLQKTKENNKKVLLHISLDLKKVATLDTILSLREL